MPNIKSIPSSNSDHSEHRFLPWEKISEISLMFRVCRAIIHTIHLAHRPLSSNYLKKQSSTSLFSLYSRLIFLRLFVMSLEIENFSIQDIRERERDVPIYMRACITSNGMGKAKCWFKEIKCS